MVKKEERKKFNARPARLTSRPRPHVFARNPTQPNPTQHRNPTPKPNPTHPKTPTHAPDCSSSSSAPPRPSPPPSPPSSPCPSRASSAPRRSACRALLGGPLRRGAEGVGWVRIEWWGGGWDGVGKGERSVKPEDIRRRANAPSE